MNVKEFNAKLTADRSGCARCPMRGRKMVGMDSSTGKPEKLPILFIGLNPGTVEAETGLPFTGPAGQLFRAAMMGKPGKPGIGLDRWGMINSLLCSAPNEASIPNVSACQACCKPKVASVARIIQAECIVPIGNSACAMFAIPDRIGVAAKKTYISRGPEGKSPRAAIMPLVHPSAILRNGGEGSGDYKAFVDRLIEIKEMFQDGTRKPEGRLSVLFTGGSEAW